MTLSTYLADEVQFTVADLVGIIREQLEQPYPMSDNLRTAVMYCPRTMTPAQWVAACLEVGVNQGSARNRYNEVQHQLRELGEI